MARNPAKGARALNTRRSRTWATEQTRKRTAHLLFGVNDLCLQIRRNDPPPERVERHLNTGLPKVTTHFLFFFLFCFRYRLEQKCGHQHLTVCSFCQHMVPQLISCGLPRRFSSPNRSSVLVGEAWWHSSRCFDTRHNWCNPGHVPLNGFSFLDQSTQPMGLLLLLPAQIETPTSSIRHLHKAKESRSHSLEFSMSKSSIEQGVMKLRPEMDFLRYLSSVLSRITFSVPNPRAAPAFLME